MTEIQANNKANEKLKEAKDKQQRNKTSSHLIRKHF